MYPSERVEQKKQMVAFDKMVAKSTGSLDVIREFFKDDKQWGRLVSLVRISYSYPSVADPGKFREAAGSARQNDTSGLKHKLDYVLSDAMQALVPKLSDSASKSDCALNHLMLSSPGPSILQSTRKRYSQKMHPKMLNPLRFQQLSRSSIYAHISIYTDTFPAHSKL
jgi:hypothetical protein